MKKTFMYLIAIVATLATTFAMSSCSDDDDNNDGQYTLRIRVTQGSLNDVYYAALRQMEQSTTVSTDRAAAERAFDMAISSAEVELQTKVNEMATAAGVYDFSIVFELLDGKGKVVKTKVLVPTNNPG
ncbi:MAG: hypothetical protein MJY59_05885 [Bacteroidaceae bacterium]|nr:hypothetical protein [Bacteroidaceae bacterium]